MHKHKMRACVMGALLAAVATSSLAQTPARTTAASAPTAVGVTPQTAAAANERAIPRSDTATVVRTGPTATERARDARPMANTGNAGNANRAGSGTQSTQPAGGMQATTTTGDGAAPLPARADRN